LLSKFSFCLSITKTDDRGGGFKEEHFVMRTIKKLLDEEKIIARLKYFLSTVRYVYLERKIIFIKGFLSELWRIQILGKNEF